MNFDWLENEEQNNIKKINISFIDLIEYGKILEVRKNKQNEMFIIYFLYKNKLYSVLSTIKSNNIVLNNIIKLDCINIDNNTYNSQELLTLVENAQINFIKFKNDNELIIAGYYNY